MATGKFMPYSINFREKVPYDVRSCDDVIGHVGTWPYKGEDIKRTMHLMLDIIDFFPKGYYGFGRELKRQWYKMLFFNTFPFPFHAENFIKKNIKQF